MDKLTEVTRRHTVNGLSTIYPQCGALVVQLTGMAKRTAQIQALGVVFGIVVASHPHGINRTGIRFWAVGWVNNKSPAAHVFFAGQLFFGKGEFQCLQPGVVQPLQFRALGGVVKQLTVYFAPTLIEISHLGDLFVGDIGFEEFVGDGAAGKG